MIAQGRVHKYGDNVDTDVIIPARYLNTSKHEELAAHCMEAVSYTHLNQGFYSEQCSHHSARRG